MGQNCKTSLSIRENSKPIKNMGMENANGLMAKNMRDSGLLIKEMEVGSGFQPRVRFIRGNGLMEKLTGME